ncbi:lanthionine synthetase C family protein [Micromonospora sp. NPDC005652]|uniref:lanthionine synthetase C family protein n=1 Tax=Micromonospora sp. NPDC005652 TaxID=3157046 RepID=UPI0033EC13D9
MTSYTRTQPVSTLGKLAAPLTHPPGAEPTPGWHQSLGKGAAGIALLHAERANAGVGDWATAHAWLTTVISSGLSAGPDAGLFFGAPAAAFAIHTAAQGDPGRYRRALATLDNAVAAMTVDRLGRAHARIDAGKLPATTEFDLISGMTGIGALLLRRNPDGELLRQVLAYLVRLTEPLAQDGRTLPGWWTYLGPRNRVAPDFPRGHGNLGIAHGITGPLALLSLAARAGVVVDGQAAAIRRICDFLTAWRQEHDEAPGWPQWLTVDADGRQRPGQQAPGRPSWCYGTPGQARALQLAGIALADAALLDIAEEAMAACLDAPGQLALMVDGSLCHGWAGLLQVTARFAADARQPFVSEHLAELVDRLLAGGRPAGSQIGLLEGDAGVVLALHTAAAHAAPSTGWDACMLLA